MKRSTTALLAALEAFVIVAVGIGAALVPLTLLWAVTFGLAVDYTVFWRAAADIWLLGHGVDLTVEFDAVTATALGVPGAADSFDLTIAALGFALVTALMAARTGRRAAGSGHLVLGAASAVIVFAAFSALLTLTAGGEVVRPEPVQGLVLPPLVLAGGMAAGAVLELRRLGALAIGEEADTRFAGLRSRLALVPPAVRRVTADAVVGGVMVTAGIVAVAALVTAMLIVLGYATLAGLSQTLQAGVVGGIALTLAQLALLPNAIVWVASWIVGPGFAIGAGTSVSPGGTVLGPVPGLPLLGIVPADGGAGYLALLVPAVLGFVAGLVAVQRAPARDGWVASLARGAGTGIVAGALMGLLAWWSSGAAGPGRLVEVGPHGWVVAGATALAVGAPAVLGAVAARLRR